jgi:hypothetical protein
MPLQLRIYILYFAEQGARDGVHVSHEYIMSNERTP